MSSTEVRGIRSIGVVYSTVVRSIHCSATAGWANSMTMSTTYSLCQKTRSVIRGSRRKGGRKRGSVLACGAARRYFILTSYGVTLFILTSYVIWLVA